jgi:hypothetical protein
MPTRRNYILAIGMRERIYPPSKANSDHIPSLILATQLNPISILSRVTPYLAGSANIVMYSSHQQVLAEVLEYTKRDPNYLNETLSESWTRTYQVRDANSREWLIIS